MRNRLRKIENFFDDLGVRQDIEEDCVLNYERKVRRHQIADILKAEDGGLILYTGCGSGRDAGTILVTSDGEYVGVDIYSKSLHEALRKHLQVHLTRADMRFLAFKDGSFNQIVCSEVLEHIYSWKKAVKEFYLVLKPNKTVVISTLNMLSVYCPQKLFLEKKYGTKHPYDEWKNPWIIKKGLEKLSLRIIDVRGACILTCYTKAVKKAFLVLLSLFEYMEKVLCSKTLMRYFSYMCIIKARKCRLNKYS
ncbi:MAG: class I SAM-dependent methyltransferase [Candidatus Methanosuratincola petrocarbonis]